MVKIFLLPLVDEEPAFGMNTTIFPGNIARYLNNRRN